MNVVILWEYFGTYVLVTGKGKGKSKVVPELLTEPNTMKAYWGGGSTAPHILDLSTRWK
jgi:hypothetical protein